MALALQTLVDYGEAFGAQRLVPIKSGHLAGSFAILKGKDKNSLFQKNAGF